ncbi:MAG: hypothetical protein ACI9MR_001696 [Myxococcota bacterium]|jgi:hypothetical protein
MGAALHSDRAAILLTLGNYMRILPLSHEKPNALKVPMVLALVSLLAVGCSSEKPDARNARVADGIEISVAALSLAGIDIACYDVAVTTATDTVWTQGDPSVTALGHDQDAPPDPNGTAIDPPDTATLCSDQYGNGGGGAITYIGPCDASADADTDTGADGVQNTVTLWVDGLYGDGGDVEIGEWQDPCPSGCQVQIDCVENADSLAEFNLTVMRQANQGFFDIAVNFEDIFCSAKVDCAYPDGPNVGPIELLFNPTTGERAQTAVLGFACTGGPAATAEAPNDTVLLRDPIYVACGAQTTVIDPSQGVGNAYTAANPDPDLTDAVWQYAVYAGNEDLECGGLSCNKRYWNVAIGFDPTVSDCTLTTRATAGTPGGLSPDSPFASPDATVYPLIDIDVRLTALTGGLACSQHPLNTPGSGVATRYTAVDAPEQFCGRFEGDVFACSDDAGCPEPPVANVVSGNVVNDSIAGAIQPTSLARARNGDLFAAFNDKGDAGPGAVAYLTRSIDNGQTWEQTPHRTFEATAPLVGIAAGIASLPNGDLVATAIEIAHNGSDRASTIRLYRSTDNGTTFTEEQTLDTDPDALPSTMGTIVQLANGDLIMPAYAYTSCCAQLAPYKYGSGFFRSTDGGDSWGQLELAYTDPPPGGSFMAFNEAAFVVRSDGSIVAQARAGSGTVSNLWYVESFDDGLSWTAPQEANVQADFPAVARISDCSYVMVAGEYGVREGVGGALFRTTRVFKSRDGINYEFYANAEYSHPHDIPNSGNTGGAQGMVRLPDGSFYVVYYAFRYCDNGAVPCGVSDPPNANGYDFYIDGMLLRP